MIYKILFRLVGTLVLITFFQLSYCEYHDTTTVPYNFNLLFGQNPAYDDLLINYLQGLANRLNLQIVPKTTGKQYVSHSKVSSQNKEKSIEVDAAVKEEKSSVTDNEEANPKSVEIDSKENSEETREKQERNKSMEDSFETDEIDERALKRAIGKRTKAELRETRRRAKIAADEARKAAKEEKEAQRQLRLQEVRARQERLFMQRASIGVQCSSNADCKGGCCTIRTIRREEKQTCGLSETGGVASRCHSSCSCKGDLKCFVRNRQRQAKKEFPAGQCVPKIVTRPRSPLGFYIGEELGTELE